MANILNSYGRHILNLAISKLKENEEITTIDIYSGWGKERIQFKVNWACWGSTDPWEAKLYGERIKNTADIVDMLNHMNLVEDFTTSTDLDNPLDMNLETEELHEKIEDDANKCAWAMRTLLIGTFGDCLNSIGALKKEEN